MSTGKEPPDTQELIRFGTFELNLTTQEMRKSGTLLKLSPQPFKLLVMLARRSGQVVSRDEIQEALWGAGTYVDFEQGMNHCVKQIRNALSDSADSPLYVETVPRRGYRFLAPVVTKTILTPAPRVVVSTSGMSPRPEVLTKQQGLAGAVPQSVPDPTKTAKASTPAVEAVPAQLAAVAGEDAHSHSPGQQSGLIIVALVIAVVIAIILGLVYWRSHRSAALREKGTVVQAVERRLTAIPSTWQSLQLPPDWQHPAC